MTTSPTTSPLTSELLDHVRELQLANTVLEGQKEELAAQRQACEEGLVAAQAECGRLAVLCAAAARLLGCVDREETTAGILEIVANLVGCEEVAIYAAPPEGGGEGSAPRRVASLGTEAAAHPTLATAGHALSVPLQRGDVCIGAIALFRLLPHKAGLDPVDREVLALAARHAAAVLARSRRDAEPA